MKYLFFLILPLGVFSQNLEIEKLVNQLVEDEIPADFEYFNLVDSSFAGLQDPWLKDEIKEVAIEFNLTDLNPEDFLIHPKDSVLNWNDYKIEKARINSYNKIPKLFFNLYRYIIVNDKISKAELDSLYQNKNENEFIVPVKNHWGKKRIRKETEKIKRDYENSFRMEDREYYSISKPKFDSSGKYALIGISRSQGGSYFLYKKENANWIQITDFSRWAY